MTLYILEPLHYASFPPYIYALFLPLILSLYSISAWPSLEQSPSKVDDRSSQCKENRPPETSTTLDKQKKPAENSMSTSEFVNHAAIAWEESRRKWIGDLSQRPQRLQKDPIISWSMTYEDLLSTNDPFPKPIPLPEMVDFLVDIWYDEGLFD